MPTGRKLLLKLLKNKLLLELKNVYEIKLWYLKIKSSPKFTMKLIIKIKTLNIIELFFWHINIFERKKSLNELISKGMINHGMSKA